jgi:flagellar hook-associated protein 2
VSNVSIPNLFTGGVNFSGLIQTLVAVQSAPITQLNQQIQGWGQDQSLWQTLATKMTALESAAATLAQAGTFAQAGASSTNSGVVVAAADSSAHPGSYLINVAQLMRQEIDLGTVQEASASAALGLTGSFTIAQGSGHWTVAVTSGESLNQIASSIDTTPGIGVTASVVNNRLAIEGGNGQGLTYADPSGVLTALGILASKTATTASDVVQSAQSAAYTVDGLSLTSPTNTDTATIPGVSLAFKGVGSGVVTVATSTSAIAADVQKFVNAYNALQTTINQDTAIGGPLQGQASITTLENQMAQTATSVVAGLSGSAYQDLPDVGITLTGSGTLTVNQTTLNQALAQSPGAVAAVFDHPATGIAVQFQTLAQQYTAVGTGIIPAIVSGYAGQMQVATDQVTLLQQQLTLYQQQLQQEFLATQEMIAQLDGNSTLLSSLQSANLSAALNPTTGSASGSVG